MSSIIEQGAIFNIASRLDKFKTLNPGRVFNFRCNVCGDSQKSEFKARGYFLLNDKADIFMMKCHNCSVAYSFQHYLKLYFPDEYKELRVEIFKSRGIRQFEKPVKKEFKVEDIFDKEYQEMFKQKLAKTESPSFFQPAYELSEHQEAYKYLNARDLPMSAYNRLYRVKDFEAFIRAVVPAEHLENKNIPNDERIVFVLQTIDGEIMGFQGRAVDPNSSLRYSIIMMSSTYPKIFGLENIDKNSDKTIFVTEGAFDSFFINGAIALNGGDTNALNDILEFEGIDKNRVVVVLDNEPRSKDTISRMNKSINDGFKIALWDKLRTEHKDINDMILNGVFDSDGTFNRTNTLRQYLLNNHYKGDVARAKLKFWSKV